MNQVYLFEVPTGKPCKRCGTLFQAKEKNHKYCSDQCRDLSAWQKWTAVDKDRAELLAAGFELPQKGKFKDERGPEAVELYKKGCGLTSIARMQGRSKRAVAKALIKAGVYKPDPKHNGIAKKGTGKASKILLQQRRKAREEEKKKARRHKIATCLWALRKKVGIQTTCRTHNWPWQTVYQLVSENKTYKRFKEKYKPIEDQQAKKRNNGSLSKKYKDEYEFQDAIEAILAKEGISYEKEFKSPNSRASIDFKIGDRGVECKVESSLGAAQKLIGQLLIYRTVAKLESICLIPDDISFPSEAVEVMTDVGFTIVYEKDFLGWLNGGGIANIAIRKPRRIPFKCKSCGSIGSPSYSPSKCRRSYCVACEPLIASGAKVWNPMRDMWVSIGEIGTPIATDS